MLCLEDCFDFSDLAEDEVAAIAEHEHIPEIVAAELGNELLKTNTGVMQLHTMILEDIETALARGRLEHAAELATTYQHFQTTHPLLQSSSL